MKKYYVSVVLDEDNIEQLEMYSQGASVASLILDHATELKPLEVPYKTICLDLDGTVLELTDKYPAFGKVKPFFKEVLKLFKSKGYRVGILTARSDENIKGLAKYLEDNGIKVDFIQHDPKDKKEDKSVKPKADMYLDDRGFFFSGDWKKDYSVIEDLLSTL